MGRLSVDPKTHGEEYRKRAAELFNGTWELLDKADRDETDDLNMIHQAHASRYLWGLVGKEPQLATGEWQVSRVYAALGMGQALPIVEAWLISNPEIEVIFAANDDMALGAIQALTSANRLDIKVFSVDANELGCQALIDGTLSATVAQDTFGYAHGAADYAAKLIKGEAVESQRLNSVLILPDAVDQILLTVHGYTEEQVKALYK